MPAFDILGILDSFEDTALATSSSKGLVDILFASLSEN